MTNIEKQVVAKVLKTLVTELYDHTKRERVREGIIGKDGKYDDDGERVEFTKYRFHRELVKTIPFFATLSKD